MDEQMKNTMEVIAALKELALAGKKIMADGKVNLEDLPTLIELAGKAQVFANAIQGIDLVGEELKGAGLAGVAHLLIQLQKHIEEIKAA